MIFSNWANLLRILVIISLSNVLEAINCTCRPFVADRMLRNAEERPTFYPWHVSIGLLKNVKNENGKRKKNWTTSEMINTHRCSGILINENWALITAYCANKIIKDKIKNYGVGVSNSNNLTKIFEAGRIPIEKIHLHEQYNTTENKSKNNLALLKLSVTLKFNGKDIQPACFLDREQHDYKGLLNVVGFGSPSKFRHLPSHYFPLITESIFVDSRMTSKCTDKILCSKMQANLNICDKEDGSTVHRISNGYFTIIGVFSVFDKSQSSDSNCAIENSLIRLSNYKQWIKSIVGNNICFISN